MPITLGLEAVAPEDDVTIVDLLQAKFKYLQAQHEYELAAFEAAEMERNVHNYNEIITQLKKHSSAECLAFAQDLIGYKISLEAETVKADEKVNEKSKSKLKTMIDAIVEFVHTCTKWIRKQIAKLMAKLTAVSVAGMQKKVSFRTELLDKITDMCSKEYSTDDITKMNNLIWDIRDRKPVTIDLGKDGREWLEKAHAAQEAVNKFAKATSIKFTAKLVDLTGQYDFKQAANAFQNVCKEIEKPLMKDISSIAKCLVRIDAHNRYKKEAEAED